jgi:hypothetical protein
MQTSTDAAHRKIRDIKSRSRIIFPVSHHETAMSRTKDRMIPPIVVGRQLIAMAAPVPRVVIGYASRVFSSAGFQRNAAFHAKPRLGTS